MTLLELSVEYEKQSEVLTGRLRVLRCERGRARDKTVYDERIHILETMRRETGELAALTRQYYDKGYRRNGKYTV